MTPKLWTFAILGILAALAAIAGIVWDVRQVLTDGTTFSMWSYATQRTPIPFLLGLLVGFVIGGVAGHLYWPIHTPTDPVPTLPPEAPLRENPE